MEFCGCGQQFGGDGVVDLDGRGDDAACAERRGLGLRSLTRRVDSRAASRRRRRGDRVNLTPSPRPSSLTRRDGPDVVRNSSKSLKKLPTTSSDGHESRRRREGTPRPRLVLVLRVEGNIKHLPEVPPHFINISLPKAFLDRACAWRRRFRAPRGVSPGSSPREEAAGGLETPTAPTRSECPQNRRRNHAHGREMETSRLDGVKAPQHLDTRRAHRPART